MITYPIFVAALADIDVDTLARLSGVPATTIQAIAAGGGGVALDDQARLAGALGVEPADLFRIISVLDGGRVQVELPAAVPVTDPTILRALDRRAS
jgi:hypothetical protein